MKEVGVTLWELSPEEIYKLPHDFELLVYFPCSKKVAICIAKYINRIFSGDFVVLSYLDPTEYLTEGK